MHSAPAWLFERTTGLTNPTALPLAWLEAHPVHLLVALTLGALLARSYDAADRPTRTPSWPPTLALARLRSLKFLKSRRAQLQP